MKATNGNEKPYHYTECGLDNVRLMNGFKVENTPQGKRVSIKNIEGLHDAIGHFLVFHKKNLSGKEFRFLRHELLLSQSNLAKLLDVSEQAINRWENEKSEINKSAEIIIRLLFCEHLKDKSAIAEKKPAPLIEKLRQIANIDDEADQIDSEIRLEPKGKEWRPKAA